MKRRTREPHDAPAGPSRPNAPQPPARRFAGGPLALAGLLLVLVVAALWFMRARLPWGASTDPEMLRLAHLSQAAAYDSALSLGRAGRHQASLPYYRRALTGRTDLNWTAHYNYASALYNVSLEVREVHGLATPATRSSIERVALMRAAMAQLDTAQRLATTAAESAIVIRARGERLEIWGLPWEAFLELRKAEWTNPAVLALRMAAESYMMVMRYPEQRWSSGAGAPPRPVAEFPSRPAPPAPAPAPPAPAPAPADTSKPPR